MQVVSSTTTMPPEPTIAPAFMSVSYWMGVSNSSAGRHPPLGPPICTALVGTPPWHPPPISLTSSPTVRPNGTSTRPLWRTLPVSAKTFVPLLSLSPIDEYASAPWLTIHATLASVSTLLMQVGRSHSPEVVGKGGRGLGMPRWPSTEAMSAVSSPHTKAPAPSLTRTV